MKIIKNKKINEAIEIHPNLNPALWENDKLIPEVREKIQEIVKHFLEKLNEDGIKLVMTDIIILGSNCSYNYSKNSDLDIHIEADTSTLQCPDELYPKLYSAYKTIYNNKYDITIHKIPVEIFIDTEDTPVVSNGIYSVQNDEWIKEPEVYDKVNYDEKEFNKLFKDYESRYNKLTSKAEKQIQSKKVGKDIIEEIQELIEDIYDLRKTGLSKDGELGLNNSIFREMRSKGYLDNLKDLRVKAESEMLSLKESLLPDNGNEAEDTPYDRALEQLCQASGCPVILQADGSFTISGVSAGMVSGIICGLNYIPEVCYVDSDYQDSFNTFGCMQPGGGEPCTITGVIQIPEEQLMDTPIEIEADFEDFPDETLVNTPIEIEEL